MKIDSFGRCGDYLEGFGNNLEYLRKFLELLGGILNMKEELGDFAKFLEVYKESLGEFGRVCKFYGRQIGIGGRGGGYKRGKGERGIFTESIHIGGERGFMKPNCVYYWLMHVIKLLMRTVLHCS